LQQIYATQVLHVAAAAAATLLSLKHCGHEYKLIGFLFMFLQLCVDFQIGVPFVQITTSLVT
jgi:hypothetical protein